jgi:hypothetical protein
VEGNIGKCNGGGKNWSYMRSRQKHDKLSLITTSLFTHHGTLNLTTHDNLIAVHVHMAYRSQFSDEETVNQVKKELKENNIEYSKLVDFPMENCK